MNERPYYILEVDRGGRAVHYLTLLAPASFAGKSLPPEAIVGQLRVANGVIEPANFVANPRFLELMHSVIAARAGADPDLTRRATALGNGTLPLVDGRAGAAGTAQAGEADLIGTFEVAKGLIGAWRPNPAHQTISARGLFRLPPGLHQQVVDELLRRVGGKP